MNASFSTVLVLRLLHSFEWMKPIVEKLCSAVALEVAMLKGLVAIFWSSGHSHPSTNQYSSWIFETFSKTLYQNNFSFLCWDVGMKSLVYCMHRSSCWEALEGVTLSSGVSDRVFFRLWHDSVGRLWARLNGSSM
jgi:hypothetical protein